MPAQVTEASVHEKLKEFYKFFPDQVEEALEETAGRLLEALLKEEIDILVGAERYERSERRRGYRNGHYVRRLISHHGLLQVRVPRVRRGGVEFASLARYRRYSGEVAELIRGLFFAGVSTRKMGLVLEHLLGTKVSPQMVSRVVQQMDAEVRLFHSRMLADQYRYLFLDGIVQSEHSLGGGLKGPVLVAYGIRSDGRREIIDHMRASSESESAWEGFLNNLYRRGLTGHRLDLIVADGCTGLWNALERVYPRAPRQLCWAHKMRNIQDKLPKKAWATCLDEAKEIYRQESKDDAADCYFAWVKKWRSIYPDAVRCLRKDIDKLLVFHLCPKQHRSALRTTNRIERLFREVRRRTRPMGSFTNSKSIDRISYGIFWIINKHWEATRIATFTHKS
jgi:putative transposase